MSATAGPWVVANRETCPSVISLAPRGRGEKVCDVYAPHTGTDSEWKNNADLIASALELREGLRTLRNAAMNTPALDSSKDWTELIEETDKILAKAEGRT